MCDPRAWAASVLFHEQARAALQHVVAFGFQDTLRLHTQDAGLYSWWDYRMLGFPKNQGLRIDLILATEAAAARLHRRLHRPQRAQGPAALGPRAGAGRVQPLRYERSRRARSPNLPEHRAAPLS